MNLGDEEIILRGGSEVAEAVSVSIKLLENALDQENPCAHVESLIENVNEDVTAEEKAKLAETLLEFCRRIFSLRVRFRKY